MKRKPRSDSKLKNLSLEKQEQLAEWLRTPKTGDCEGGIRFAMRKCLEEWDLAVGKNAVSEFLPWWDSQEQLRSDNNLVEDFQEFVSTQTQGHDPEKAREFLLQAIAFRNYQRGEDKTAMMALSEQGRAKLEREKVNVAWERTRQSDRRIRLLEQNAAEAKAKLEEVKSKGGLTDETLRKIEEAAKLL